ncbi:hypothetical protein [Thomasclavelia cocleata]|uniref:hypothetical protein n=1 Tax=Thomasclavelia cocleata TaxID=69824 RepID=UPI00256EDC60|nr:hypothetical protein [Thomasclavelia cocleata]
MERSILAIVERIKEILEENPKCKDLLGYNPSIKMKLEENKLILKEIVWENDTLLSAWEKKIKPHLVANSYNITFYDEHMEFEVLLKYKNWDDIF